MNPTVFEKSEIELVTEGKVAWGGGLTPGLLLVMKDGARVPLPLSGGLGQQRRREWITAIDRWIVGAPPDG